MQPITDSTQIEHYGTLLREMMLIESGREYHFNAHWVREHHWKIVPVESGVRLPDPGIAQLVSALQTTGDCQCVAVFNEPGYIQTLPAKVASEPPSDMSTCYRLSATEADFREFNRVLGVFRTIVTSEDRAWAISCNEWFNLYGAKPELLEALLGKPIDEARQEFFQFASLLAHRKEDEPLIQVAKHYSVL